MLKCVGCMKFCLSRYWNSQLKNLNLQYIYNATPIYCAKTATIHQATTMLATSTNVQFPCHNRLLTTDIDDLTFWLSPELQTGATRTSFTLHLIITLAPIKVSSHQFWRLAGGYDLDIAHCLRSEHRGYLVDSVFCAVIMPLLATKR